MNAHFNYYFSPTETSEIQKEFELFIQRRSKDYTHDLLEWHDALSGELSKVISKWWYSAGSRLIAWQPPIYQPLYYALALKEFRQLKKLQTTHISGHPKELETYLRDIDPDGVYTYDSKNLRMTLKERAKNFLAPYWELTRLFYDCLFNSHPLPKKSSFAFLIYSHIWGFKRLAHSQDHFYGQMLSSHNIGTDALWIYYAAKRISRDEKRQTMEKLAPHKVIFLEDHWTITDALGILAELIHFKFQALLIQKTPTLKMANITCPAFQNYFVSSMVKGSFPITELKVERFFRKLLKNVDAKNLIYPFEDKGLERAILTVTKDFKIRPMGFAHAVHNPGHLYLFKKYHTASTPPRPKIILTTGENASFWLHHEATIPKDHLVSIGSPRYKEPLNKIEKSAQEQLKVLILIGQAHELAILANWVEEEPSLFNDCEVMIRHYPYADQEEQNRHEKRLAKHIQTIRKNDSSLNEQIQWCHVAVFSSTSAGFEAILAGRAAVYANLHHLVSLDSIEGKGDISAIPICHNSRLLAEKVYDLKMKPQEELIEMANQQRGFTVGIYSKPNIKAFLELSHSNTHRGPA